MKIRDKFELIYLKEIIRNIFNVQTKSFHNGSPLIAVLLPKLNWFNSSINRRNYEIFKCNYQASADTKTEEKNMQNASAARRGKKVLSNQLPSVLVAQKMKNII